MYYILGHVFVFLQYLLAFFLYPLMNIVLILLNLDRPFSHRWGRENRGRGRAAKKEKATLYCIGGSQHNQRQGGVGEVLAYFGLDNVFSAYSRQLPSFLVAKTFSNWILLTQHDKVWGSIGYGEPANQKGQRSLPTIRTPRKGPADTWEVSEVTEPDGWAQRNGSLWSGPEIWWRWADTKYRNIKFLAVATKLSFW